VSAGVCVGRSHVGAREVDELCADGYCRACHVSLSFEACVSGEWVDSQRKAVGLRRAR
jgi:hypothetical protein